MIALKLTTVGSSTGVVLPKEVLTRLKVKKGDTLYLVETPDGFQITPYDESFVRQVRAAERVMREHRDVLHELAKSSSEPEWLLTQVVLTVHRMLIAEHGGTEGLRDPGLLDSALARPKNLFVYADPPPIWPVFRSQSRSVPSSEPETAS